MKTESRKIRAEIERLIEIVRYSPGTEANIVAPKVVTLKRKLAELESNIKNQEVSDGRN
jgi:ribosome-interacting GTPase 1